MKKPMDSGPWKKAEIIREEQSRIQAGFEVDQKNFEKGIRSRKIFIDLTGNLAEIFRYFGAKGIDNITLVFDRPISREKAIEYAEKSRSLIYMLMENENKTEED